MAVAMGAPMKPNPKGLGPHTIRRPPVQSCSMRWYSKKQERTQEIIQGDVDWSDKKDDTSGCVKQVLGLEVPPGDVIEPVCG